MKLKKELDSQFLEACGAALPEFEQDILKLYLDHRLTQKAIAQTFKVTQGGISTKLKKIIQRLKYLSTVKVPNFKLTRKLLGDLHTNIIIYFIKTTSQTQTARQVNKLMQLNPKEQLNQVKVKYILKKSVTKLRLYSRDKKYKQVNPVLKEIQRAQNNQLILHYPANPNKKGEQDGLFRNYPIKIKRP